MEKAVNAFEFRRSMVRDIPEAKETALMGLSAADLDVKKIAAALTGGKIKGIAILAGTNNVKFTQDLPFVTLAQEFLKDDILCISEGDASVSLAKYGFLEPPSERKALQHGVWRQLLKAAGKNLPAVIDLGLSGKRRRRRVPVRPLPRPPRRPSGSCRSWPASPRPTGAPRRPRP